MIFLRMSTPIELLWKQAVKTFSGCESVGYKMCKNNFDKLNGLINNIRAEDVCVDKRTLDHVENDDAPMCVIDIFENNDITIAIFLLKHGETLPMHDHPGMHGLLKVISGTVKIDSYTPIKPTENLSNCTEVLALKHPSKIVGKNDPACVLLPHEQNLHEITCIEGPVAFLDVLSPSYNVSSNRSCTFFKQVPYGSTSPRPSPTSSSSSSPKSSDDLPVKVKLLVTEQPPDFYSSSLKYLGPPLR
ncbi:2-aminoethanethiol dioxygenase [Microplitis mediator]|uniref:2-aminoethanethiol dioxygenase n=1 Tax=Microplitis mediator TaxID=375433 RepID=UPI002552EBC0|nr:2-aminoethanethiol dioxygenase [Microplitis mediator]